MMIGCGEVNLWQLARSEAVGLFLCGHIIVRLQQTEAVIQPGGFAKRLPLLDRGIRLIRHSLAHRIVATCAILPLEP